MFKTKKQDSRIRFQNSYFKRKLNEAREYKRPIRKTSENHLEFLLEKIGLGSWRTRVVSGLILLSLIYLIYVPNFLFVKNVEVNGSNEREKVLSEINSFLNKTRLLPQKNLLLLSKKDLSDYLLANDPKIFKIDKISKKFPNRLVIDLQPRYDTFILQNSGRQIILSNDGFALRAVDATSSSLSQLTNINLKTPQEIKMGERVLNPALTELLSGIVRELPKITNAKVSDFEISTPQDLDLVVYGFTSYKLIFDLKSELLPTLSNLSLLINNLSDSDKKRISYVDLRFKDKAYLCYKGTNCVKPPILLQASTTIDSKISQ